MSTLLDMQQVFTARPATPKTPLSALTKRKVLASQQDRKHPPVLIPYKNAKAAEND
jgi:hypothetical protein